MKVATEFGQLALRGVELCRRGDWDDGLALLAHVTEHQVPSQIGGLAYSYLGYGIASIRKRYREGLPLCEYAMKVDACEPEVYLNLSRLLLLIGKRRRAIGILNRGLAMDPRHSGLVGLRQELGVRRAPVLPFIARSNPVNRVLGRIRHRLRSD